MAGRFAQTLLMKIPECVSTNPVKMAFSIAKVIIEMKDVGCHLYISNTACLTIISGDRRQQGRARTTSRRNSEQAPGCGEDNSNRSSEGCRTGDGETQTVRRPPCANLKWYNMMNTSSSRILQAEMKKLEDLTRKSLAIRILDHEEYQKMIGQIFQRVNGATTSFQVITLIFI